MALHTGCWAAPAIRMKQNPPDTKVGWHTESNQKLKTAVLAWIESSCRSARNAGKAHVYHSSRDHRPQTILGGEKQQRPRIIMKQDVSHIFTSACCLSIDKARSQWPRRSTNYEPSLSSAAVVSDNQYVFCLHDQQNSHNFSYFCFRIF